MKKNTQLILGLLIVLVLGLALLPGAVFAAEDGNTAPLTISFFTDVETIDDGLEIINGITVTSPSPARTVSNRPLPSRKMSPILYRFPPAPIR